jgi:hypothetical protein
MEEGGTQSQYALATRFAVTVSSKRNHGSLRNGQFNLARNTFSFHRNGDGIAALRHDSSLDSAGIRVVSREEVEVGRDSF